MTTRIRRRRQVIIDHKCYGDADITSSGATGCPPLDPGCGSFSHHFQESMGSGIRLYRRSVTQADLLTPFMVSNDFVNPKRKYNCSFFLSSCLPLSFSSSWSLCRSFTPRLSSTVIVWFLVGGGSAGAVIANRLSENPHWKILLLEAGGSESILSDIPLAAATLQMTPIDWAYQTEPQEASCFGLINRRSRWPRGRVLGGSSVLNYMLYIRGNRRDYDKWYSLGNYGWSWDEVLPYFLKSEDNRDPSVAYNGKSVFPRGSNLTVLIVMFLISNTFCSSWHSDAMTRWSNRLSDRVRYAFSINDFLMDDWKSVSSFFFLTISGWWAKELWSDHPKMVISWLLWLLSPDSAACDDVNQKWEAIQSGLEDYMRLFNDDCNEQKIRDASEFFGSDLCVSRADADEQISSFVIIMTMSILTDGRIGLSVRPFLVLINFHRMKISSLSHWLIMKLNFLSPFFIVSRAHHSWSVSSYSLDPIRLLPASPLIIMTGDPEFTYVHLLSQDYDHHHHHHHRDHLSDHEGGGGHPLLGQDIFHDVLLSTAPCLMLPIGF